MNRQIALFLLVMIPLVAAAQPSQHLADSDNLTTAEAHGVLCPVLMRLHADKGKGIWPGYDPLETPLIVKYPEVTYGYGKASEFTGWQEIKNDSCTAYMAPKSFTPPAAPIVPIFNFGQSKAFYFNMGMKPHISLWLLTAVVHERFHRYQWEHFPNYFSLLGNEFTNHTDVDVVTATLLENRQLSSFLQTGSSSALFDYVSLASHRDSLLSPDSKKWELYQQIVEGTATFVQLKAFTNQPLPFGLNFHEVWKNKMQENLSLDLGVDGVIKWRHYAVGSILYQGIDKNSKNEDWKIDIESMSAGSIFKLLDIFKSTSESDLRKRSEEILSSNEGVSIGNQSVGLIQNYKNEIQSLLNKSEELPYQFVLHLEGNGCSGGGQSSRTYYLPTGGMLSKDSEKSNQCDSGYQHNFYKIPILLELPKVTKFGVNKFKVWLDGVEVDPRAMQGTYNFKSLKIESDVFTLDNPIAGRMEVKELTFEIFAKL